MREGRRGASEKEKSRRVQERDLHKGTRSQSASQRYPARIGSLKIGGTDSICFSKEPSQQRNVRIELRGSMVYLASSRHHFLRAVSNGKQERHRM
jgi:hypothetical protein